MPSLTPTTWNSTRLKYRLPGWETDAAYQGSAVQSLAELEDQENQRLARKAQGGPFASGYTGAKDYAAGLNRQGRMADLRSKLAGQGPATVKYGGSFSGGDSMGPATQALRRRAGYPGGDPTEGVDFNEGLADDTLRFQMGTAARDRALTGNLEDINESRRRAADFAAKTDPYEARRRGDIVRDEHVRDAEAKSRGDVAAFQAPGAADVRRQRMWDKEEELRSIAPYTPAVVVAGTRADADRYAADAKVDASGVTGQSRVASSAVGALGRVGSAPTFTPQDRATRDRAYEAIAPNVPGQGGGRDGGAGAAGKVFPRARLSAWAAQNGFESEQAAEEFLDRVYGYAVR